MKIYRITKRQYLTNYTGMGSSFNLGGRWNRPGTPVLYFALSPSVAMLEMANYHSSPRLIPPSTYLGTYEIPDDTDIDLFPLNGLPSDWASFPYPTSTQETGDAWLKFASTFALSVPSCAVPSTIERTLVVNPNHDIFKSLSIQLVDYSRQIFNPRAFPGV